MDEEFKRFLLTFRSKGVANTVAVVAVARALTEKSPDVSLKVLDNDNSYPAKSLFVRMGFVKRACTTTRPEISEGARKEAELISRHEIVSIALKNSIPTSHLCLVKPYTPMSSQKMTARSSNRVYVAGFTYKQAITGTLGITISSNFLPIELLIYGGKLF